LLRFDRRLSRALLAYLLLHANEPVSTDRLVDQLWGERPPKTAVSSLRNYVSRLRKAIGSERLRLEAAGYVLRVDPERFDLARFDRLVAEARAAPAKQRADLLKQALALWRGEPLEDLAYEEFAQAEIAQLRERRLCALEGRLEADLELGRGPELVQEIEGLISLHPLRERLRGQLMLALYRAGRQADALRAYQDARGMLQDELGLEPSEELRGLERRILEQDPLLLSKPAEGVVLDSRRMVTVLFCDVVGSTRLATELDAEAYHQLMSSYFDVASEAINAHGGTIEKFVGDAVMALFGVPELHEDDALRAVRAAVDIRTAVASGRAGEDIRVRIGINTGEVVTSASSRLRAVGAAVNVAAHLEERAGASEIVLGAATEPLVREAVRATKIDLGDGLTAWRLQEVIAPVAAVERRTPLVGRRRELRRLEDVFQRTREEKLCNVVTIVGEAGIGKSRLAREFLDAVRREARVLVGRCLPYGAGATYLPIADIVRGVAPDASVAGIAELLGDTEDAQRVAEHVAGVVGGTGASAVEGEVFWAIRRLLEAIAHERPLAVAFDDLHWAEPPLLDLVDYLGEWAQGPILIVSLARTELVETRPGWAGPSSSGFLVELEPLAAEDVSALLEAISGGPVAPDLREQIVDHAGGNPLFAEQLLLLVAERADVRLDQAPPTVEALIAARLDRLEPSELELLRRASVIGRLFTVEALRDLGEFRDADLASVERRGLVHRMERDPGHRFHHVLVRDVTYRSIPKAERANLHERVADNLERHDDVDELVGYHLEQAYLYRDQLGPPDATAEALGLRGATRLFAAGQRARDRGDFASARALLERAIDLSPTKSTVRRSAQLELLEVLNGLAEYDRSLSLLDELAAAAEASADRRIHALVTLERIWAKNQTEGLRLEEALRAAGDATGTLEKLEEPDGLARGLMMTAMLHSWGGETAEAERLLGRALEHAERAGRVALVGDVLEWLCMLALSGPTPTTVGIRRCEMARQRARGCIKAEASALVARGVLLALRRDANGGRDSVARGRSLYLELGDRMGWGATALMAAEIEMLVDDYVAAEELLLPACELLRQQRQHAYLATLEGLLAQALLAQDRDHETQRLCDEVRRIAAADDLDAHIRVGCLSAILAARRGEPEAAHDLLEQAKAIADPTDYLRLRAFVALSTAEVGRLTGQSTHERSALQEALRLSEVKGDLATAALAQEHLGRPTAVRSW
jgi:DNA-binding SARP family transcriptional activator